MNQMMTNAQKMMKKKMMMHKMHGYGDSSYGEGYKKMHKDYYADKYAQPTEAPVQESE